MTPQVLPSQSSAVIPYLNVADYMPTFLYGADFRWCHLENHFLVDEETSTFYIQQSNNGDPYMLIDNIIDCGYQATCFKLVVSCLLLFK